jgi:hypothetical protein
MTRTILSRLTGASVVALAAAAFAVSAASAATAPPDWIERTVAAQAGSAPDAVDRALAARARDTWYRDRVAETRTPDAVDRAVAARARESRTPSTAGASVLDSGSNSNWPTVGALAVLLVALFAATLIVSTSVRRKGAQTA